MIEIPDNIESFRIDHLPIIRAYAEKIGLVNIIEHQVQSEMDLSPGIIVLGMVMDILSGRSPFYKIENFFKDKDLELLLGKKVDTKIFNDDNVGRVMDRIYETGTTKIFSELSLRALKEFGIESSYVHFDTTSVTVYGEYESSKQEEDNKKKAIKITYGHSKDHRPDLKQFLISMLCVDRNIPIFGKSEDGNESDKKVNNKILTKISKEIAEYGLKLGAYIYVGDCAVVTEENLKALEETYFITRLPASYNECSRVIKEAVEKDIWKDVGFIAKTEPTAKRPGAYYKVYNTKVNLYGTNYRAVVVHSSFNDKRKQKSIEKNLIISHKELEELLKVESKKEYYCESDAQVQLERLKKTKSEYYRLELSIEERAKYGSGRPTKNGKRQVKEVRYGIIGQIVEKTDALNKRQEEAGCFVLLSNLPEEGEYGHTSEQVLRGYKEQYGIEGNFGFLKDPIIVNDLFLKNPERVEALGLVLLISLLIWRLLERSMRLYVENTGKKLSGWDNKPTDRPTSFMMSGKFQGLLIIKIADSRRLCRPLEPAQLEYLKALGVAPDAFTFCSRRC
jgi:transposase